MKPFSIYKTNRWHHVWITNGEHKPEVVVLTTPRLLFIMKVKKKCTMGSYITWICPCALYETIWQKWRCGSKHS